MTPQERALVTELFDRLATLENTRREPDAERLIADGLARAPNAVYALVQTVLLQDEALNRADARIRELEQGAQATSAAGSSFLDAGRESGLGRTSRGSVPSISSAPKWNPARTDAAAASPTPLPNGYPPQEAARGSAFGGGSFLGTAAAAAVGVIGGNMLFNGLRNMMGGAQAQSFGGLPESGTDRASPWGADASRSELARDAGVNDVSNETSRLADHGSDRSRLFDDNNNPGDDQYGDDELTNDDDFFSDSDGDFGDDGADI